MEGNYISEIRIDEPLDKRSYLLKIPSIRYLESNTLIIDNNVTFLIGENGAGKSTLIEAIAVSMGFNAEGGTKNFNFSTKDTHSDLCSHITIARSAYPKDGFFLRAESFYNVASNVDTLEASPSFSHSKISFIDNYGGKSLHEQSHGESFLALIENRFHSNSLFILDEPEAALSPSRLMRLLVDINNLVKEGSQFIIATHSPILMSYPGALIYELSDKGINKVNYKDTEHYKITKDFLDKPEVMYKHLFNQ